MSDPFAMFAQDIKSAVPQSAGQPNQQSPGSTPPHPMSPSPQQIQQQQPVSPMNQYPTSMPMNSPVQMQTQPPTSPVASPSGNPFGAPVSPAFQAPADPFAAQASPTAKANPFGAPAAQTFSPVSPAAVPQFPGAVSPSGPKAPPPGMAPPMAPPPTMPPLASNQELVASQAPTNVWGVPEPQQQPPAPMPQQQIVPSQAPAGPWGVPPQAAAPQQPAADPFGVFGQQAPAPGAPPQQAEAAPPASLPSAEDDMWAQMGFEAPSVPAVDAGASVANGDLPSGGEYYDVKIFTKTLGIIFFRPQQVKDSLYLGTDPSLVNALGNRPVVSHILEGSSARSANISLGHVLLKVNDTEVYDPDQAVRLIKESPRPLPLLFYVPDTKVVSAEGTHMVKYDSPEFRAPSTAEGWKSKYVVVGGIISKPHLINMYRSKEEYDVAVIETQSGCHQVSVKVKQFSLLGAKLQHDSDKNPDSAMQSVKYRQKIYPWRYFMLLSPKHTNPIKVSAPSADELRPVYDGVRRTLKECGMFTEAAKRAHARPSRYTYDTGAHGYPSMMGAEDRNVTPYAYEQDHALPGVSSY